MSPAVMPTRTTLSASAVTARSAEPIAQASAAPSNLIAVFAIARPHSVYARPSMRARLCAPVYARPSIQAERAARSRGAGLSPRCERCKGNAKREEASLLRLVAVRHRQACADFTDPRRPAAREVALLYARRFCTAQNLSARVCGFLPPHQS